MSTGVEILAALVFLVVFWWLFGLVTKKYGEMETVLAITIVGSIVYASSLYIF